MTLPDNYIPNIFYNNRSVEARGGCWIEYNMNNLVPNISVTSTQLDTKYYHIFPLDSIAKPFRPTFSGIKNVILSTYDNPVYSSDKTHYPSVKSAIYPTTAPRRYYAGIDSAYKYYLTSKGGDLNATVRYVQSSISIVSAYATGQYIQYQTNGAHGLTEGLVVTISGFSNTALNCTSLPISEVTDYNTFRILKSTSVIKKVLQSVTGHVDQKTNYAVGNKITATFNKDHYLPSTCNIKIKSAKSFPSVIGAQNLENKQYSIKEGYRYADIVINNIHYDRYAYINQSFGTDIYPGDKVTITGFSDTSFNKVSATVTDVINNNLLYIDVPHVSGTTNKTLTNESAILSLPNARILYKTASANGLAINDTISITGLKITAFNLSDQTVTAVKDNYFVIENSATGTKITDGNGSIMVEDSEITISDISIPSNGKVMLYYNGTSWTTSAPSDPLTGSTDPNNPTSPLSFAKPRYVSQITIDAVGAANKFIGLIEFALLYNKDITNDLVTFSVTKDSSANSNEMLPVGLVTGNNLNLKLTSYDLDTSLYKAYNPGDVIDNTHIYLYKNIKFIPFIKLYDGYGSIVGYNEPNNFFRLFQGEYYLSDYSIDTYGSVNINALDGSKYLMEKTAPDILLENYPATAVLRILLDSVGFVNYNINAVKDAYGTLTDDSIPTINAWWTDGTKTVWQCIQEICQDMQINAIFDNNGTLQFYTRNYMYLSSKSIDWNFYYEQEGSILPNIVSFDERIIPSANQVKVKWNSPLSSKYTGSSTQLWTSPTRFLSAGGLRITIDADSSPENTILLLSFDTIDQYANQQSIYDFSGYLLIDSEIIEYDAIQYQCTLDTPIDGQSVIYPWITSQGDISKYRSLSKAGYSDISNPATSAYFKPTGRYRVKKRGALGTTPAKHNAVGSLTDILANGWNSVGISWKEK